MFCSRGLFRPPIPQADTFLSPELEDKILKEVLVEKNPPKDPDEFNLEKYYKTANHYKILIELRSTLCSLQSKLKCSTAPTSYRTMNWLISFTGIPVNQGDAADAVKIIDQAVSNMDRKRGEKFAAESVPVALKNLLTLYKLIVSKGKVTDAIDKTFDDFLCIKARDLDEAKLDELMKTIYPSGISLAPR